MMMPSSVRKLRSLWARMESKARAVAVMSLASMIERRCCYSTRRPPRFEGDQDVTTLGSNLNDAATGLFGAPFLLLVRQIRAADFVAEPLTVGEPVVANPYNFSAIDFACMNCSR